MSDDEKKEKSFPFDAVLDESNVADRIYYSEDFRNYFAQFIGNGVYPNPSDGLKVVSNDNLIVTVLPGAGFIEGAGHILKEEKDVSINTPHTNYNRKDIIVLQLNLVDRDLLIKYKPGIANSNPLEPELIRSDDIYELMLASMLIRSGTQAVTQADITDTRLDNQKCGIVHGLINQVDTTELFSQYENYWEQKTAEWNLKGEQQEQDWQNQMTDQEEAYEAQHNTIQDWYNSVKIDITKLQSFNFDNLAELVGTIKTTVFHPNGNITETIKKASDNSKVAIKESTFPPNGNVIVSTTVYDDDGISILKESTVTAIFHPDGSIEEVIT